MGVDTQNKTDQEDKPLTRADVEHFLHEAGSPEKLNLTGRNLRGVDLKHFNLAGATLREANLNGADLRNATIREADLNGANLRGAKLNGADLSKTDLSNTDLDSADLSGVNLTGTTLRGARLSYANLSGATLSGVNLSGLSLSGAHLSKADLSGANLGRADAHTADLFEANLSGANLSGANLSGTSLGRANLSGADLIGINLSGADLTGAFISAESEKDILRGLNLRSSGEMTVLIDTRVQGVGLRIYITEEPLTAHNLITIITAITELHTKCWLIQQNRFSELIEYAQSHTSRFVEEANLGIATLRYNSPVLIDFLVGSGSIAGTATLALALKTAIDAIVQTPLRFQASKLENQKKALEIKIRDQEAQQSQQIAVQKSELERQKTQLELAQQRLELAQQQLEVDRQQLEVEKNRVEIAFEIANRMVDILHPGVDTATKGMLVQPLLHNLLQLGNAKGLERALPAPQEGEERDTLSEDG